MTRTVYSVAEALAYRAQRASLLSRLFARRPDPRRPDGDEHADWLGIGTATSFHAEPSA